MRLSQFGCFYIHGYEIMTKIYEAKNHILIEGNHINPESHRHLAEHIIISKDKNMMVETQEKTFFCSGVYIPSGIIHKVETNGASVLVFLYDSTTGVAKCGSDTEPIADSICDKIIAEYSAFLKNDMCYAVFEENVIRLLGLPIPRSCAIDVRIGAAVKYIEENLSEKLTCGVVADRTGLSESRFSHLFREQVGMPFSAYVIYQRIMYVYFQIIRSGKNITEAAITAGFYSSGHFADVNRRVFGLSASRVLEKMEFMKV